ncbi:MAG: hypothetical protein ACJAXA_000317 [Candidatus Aldehydirespiratoraceae bacterium]|jgi:hypothetical protein
MSTPKKWMGFAALGAMATAILRRLWRRGNGGDTQAEPVEPNE